MIEHILAMFIDFFVKELDLFLFLIRDREKNYDSVRVIGPPVLRLYDIAFVRSLRYKHARVISWQHGGNYGYMDLPLFLYHDLVNCDVFLGYGVSPRKYADMAHEKDVLVRPYVSWTLVDGVPLIDSLTVEAGYDYLYSFDGLSEHRPWQSAHHAVERGNLWFVHRIRIDERVVEDVDPTIFRLRYRLGASRPIAGSQWYGLVSEEVFVNLNDDDEGPVEGFEQNRLRLGLGRRLGRLRVEGGYEFQYARRRADPNVFRHIVFLEFSLATGEARGNKSIEAPKCGVFFGQPASWFDCATSHFRQTSPRHQQWRQSLRRRQRLLLADERCPARSSH